MADRTLILIERTGLRRWRVRASPPPQDGTYCEDTFEDAQDAGHFAWKLRRSRGWTIVDTLDQARQAPRD